MVHVLRTPPEPRAAYSRDVDDPIRILLVDDHAVVRQGLRFFLEPDEGLEIVGEASNGQEAVAFVDAQRPDVVLMDLLMPVMDGATAIREIKRRHPDVEVIALTSVLEDRLVADAVHAGASGYLLKDTDSDALMEAIHAASRGEIRLHPDAAKRMVRSVRTNEMRESLTARETDILRWVARGYSNKDIAKEAGLSELTVKTHITRVLSKLHLENRTQAALFALQEGLAQLD